MLCSKKDPQTGQFASRNANVYTGACLLLPYFTFTAPADLPRDEVYAQSDHFLLNAKEALRYYAGCNPDFNRMYVLGAEDVIVQKVFDIGGEKQANAPSYVELLGALGARHFFGESDSTGSRVAVLGRSEAGSIGWADVPEAGVVLKAFGQLTRTAFAYLKLFYPWLSEMASMEHKWYWTLPRRRAWYQDLFERRGVKLSDPAVQQAIHAQREFFVNYLCWLRDIHAGNSADQGFRVNFADSSAFLNPDAPASLIDEKFGQLVGEGGRAGLSLDDILRRIAIQGRFTGAHAEGFGYFQRALFEACEYET